MNRHATLLVIHVAMVMGVVAFAAIVLLSLDWNELRFEANPLDLAIAASLLVPAFVVPSLVESTMLKRIAHEGADKEKGNDLTQRDHEKLMDAYQTTMIVRAALCESLAFFALVMLFTRTETQLIVIAGIALLLLIAQVPLPMRVESWISAKLQTVRDERKFASNGV